MAQSLAGLHYHLIFSTKGRAAMILPEIQPRLYEYLGGIIRADDGRLLAAGGTTNHIHLLISLRPTRAVADALRKLKCNSSKWLHETSPRMGSFRWQEGYGAFTVSYSGIEPVRSYIQQQAEHHRKLTFQEEFIAFLEKHHMAYDPAYVWD